MNVHFKDANGKYMIPRTDESGKIYQKYLSLGFDGISSRGDMRAEILVKGKFQTTFSRILRKFFKYETLKKYPYKKIIDKLFVEEDKWENVFPCIIPNWDRSPRAGREAVIYDGSSPALFEKSVEDVLSIIKDKKEEHQIVFIKSWNEWGEGNHLEPDLKFGHGYLQAIRNAVNKYRK